MSVNRKDLLRRLPSAILIGWLLVVLATAGAVASPTVRDWLGFTPPSHAYSVGEQIDAPPHTYGDAQHTLLFFTRASCPGCQKAKPILSGLVSDLTSSPVAFRVLVPQNSSGNDLEYVRSLGLAVDNMIPVNFRQFRLRVIPTAVLVDQGGRILDVSEGGESLERFANAVRSSIGGR